MKIKYAILILALASASIVRAQQISEQQAYEIALQFLSAQGGSAMRAPSRDGSPQLSLDYQARTGRKTDLYVYNREGGGFVIVSADARTVKPVLGYSDSGSIDPDNMPPALQEILSGYQEQINYARDNIKAGQDSYDPQFPVGTVIVEPLIKTTWDQTPPYNALCPMATDGTVRRTAAGCVAVSMAQIMNYWRWPEQGIGSHRNSMADSVFVDFSQSVYDWDNMPMACSEQTPQDQLYQVQKLIYDCGVAVDMEYNNNQSYVPFVLSAMTGYFNYDPGMRIYRREDYDDQEWENMMKAELDAGRPISYFGNNIGGHSFICDGYDSKNYFHFNLGWRGYADGYYLTTAIADQIPGGAYNYLQTMLIGIQPDYEDLFKGGMIYEPIEEGELQAYAYVTLTDPLDEIVIPDSATVGNVKCPVTSIVEMFYKNSRIEQTCKKLIISETIQQIGLMAFWSLQKLESVNIPKSVRIIEFGAFNGIPNLQSITVDPENPYFHSPQGSNVIIETATGRLVLGCNYSVLPDQGYTIIGENAFYGFDSIRVVRLPDFVTTVEDDAFAYCRGLKEVTFGSGIRTLGARLFSACYSLEDLYFNCDAAPAISTDQEWINPVTIHVKPSALESFQSDPVWSLHTIVADIDGSTSVPTAPAAPAADIYHDLLGRPVTTPQGMTIHDGAVWYNF